MATLLVGSKVLAWTGATTGSFSSVAGLWATPSPGPTQTVPDACLEQGLTFTPAQTISGTDGPDTLHAGPGGNLVLAQGGKDWLFGGAGRDCLDAGDNDDFVYGGVNDDVILGGSGNDWLFGGPGSDYIDGGPGIDVCYGGPHDIVVNCEVFYLVNDDDDCEASVGFTVASLQVPRSESHQSDCDEPGNSESQKSKTNSIAPVFDGALPKAPQAVSGTSDGTVATLIWEPADGAGYYNIYRSDHHGAGYEGVGSSNRTSFVDRDVTPGATYYYIVTTVGLDKIQSGDGKEVAITVVTKTPTPTPTPTPTSVAKATSTLPPEPEEKPTPEPTSSAPADQGGKSTPEAIDARKPAKTSTPPPSPLDTPEAEEASTRVP